MIQESFSAPLTYFDRLYHFAFAGVKPAKAKCFYVEEDLFSLVEKVGTYIAFVGAAAFVAGVLPAEGFLLGIVCSFVAARKTAQVALGYLIYPRAVASFFSFDNRERFRKEILELERRLTFAFSQTEVNEVVLQKGTNRYSAVECLYFGEDGIPSDKWVIRTYGNGMAVEDGCNPNWLGKGFTFEGVEEARKAKANVLFVNGPAVGKSGGLPTASHIRGVMETAIKYVESKTPSHICFYGLSIGGGMIGEALKEHSPSQNTKYLFVADRTFPSFSAAAAGVLHNVTGLTERVLSIGTSSIFRFLGLELDTLAGVRRFINLGGKIVVINGFSRGDGLLTSSAQLGTALRTEDFRLHPSIDNPGTGGLSHNGPLPGRARKTIEGALNNFF